MSSTRTLRVSASSSEILYVALSKIYANLIKLQQHGRTIDYDPDLLIFTNMDSGKFDAEFAAMCIELWAQIFRIEAGNTNPQMKSLQGIAEALGSTLEELLFGREPIRTGVLGDLLCRVQRVMESNDSFAQDALVNGLKSAEALLERRDQRHHLSQFTGWPEPLSTKETGKMGTGSCEEKCITPDSTSR